MKFNWGTGIALIYGIFVLGMVGAVIASKQHDPGLVARDYYALDLNYQAHYNKKQNAANLQEGIPVRFDPASHAITLQFPARLGAPSGKIKLFRSSTVTDDHVYEIQAGPDGLMEIPTAGFTSGLWHLEIDWAAGDKQYFTESIVTVINA